MFTTKSITERYRSIGRRAMQELVLRRGSHSGIRDSAEDPLTKMVDHLVERVTQDQASYAESWRKVSQAHEELGTYQRIAKFIGPVRKGAFLDLGCGVAYVLKHVDAAHAIGVDINPHLLNAAHETLGGAPMHGDPAVLYHPESGLAVSGWLEHMPEPFRGKVLALDDMRRLLVTLPLLLRSNLHVDTVLMSLWGGISSYLSLELLEPLKAGFTPEAWETFLHKTVHSVSFIQQAVRRLRPLLREGSRIIFTVRSSHFKVEDANEIDPELLRYCQPPGGSWEKFMEECGITAELTRHECFPGLDEQALGIDWLPTADKIPGDIASIHVEVLEFTVRKTHHEENDESSDAPTVYRQRMQRQVMISSFDRSESEAQEGVFAGHHMASAVEPAKVESWLEKASDFDKPYLWAVRLVQITREAGPRVGGEYFNKVAKLADERNPHTALLYHIRAVSSGGSNTELLPLIEKACAINERLEEAWLTLGTLYNRLNRYDDAERAWNHILLRIDPLNAHAWFCRAQSIRWRDKNYPEAERYYRAALLLNPDNAPFLVATGYILALQNKLREGWQYIHQVFAHPIDNDVLNGLWGFTKQFRAFKDMIEVIKEHGGQKSSVQREVLRAACLAHLGGHKQRQKAVNIVRGLVDRCKSVQDINELGSAVHTCELNKLLG